ncbi:ClpP/crotonase [Tilletiaria anomala UBC 951]|uniref:methylcrotonoyl-CoA carboxylase n=1 Tax=Tilletiaria anomala (strain ATCC 24038 / CBS 436.72 / UBC 951) TaxID=1037660 RepID=A0A066WHK9_TILAU|nr:ClpP/crotonase [Tilletiaria anomala UBC 951]KDN53482.1 ClpP/crotonase [Tilletiaria anomala UBC 951]
MAPAWTMPTARMTTLQQAEAGLHARHPALAYPPINLPLIPPSDEMKEIREGNLSLIHDWRERIAAQMSQGPSSAQALHFRRGMLLTRDRIALLLDQDSPWLELCAFAGYDQEDSTPCASTVAGIGLVNGVLCMISSGIPTLQGGSINEMAVLKGERIAQIAAENRLPGIGLVQSAGANLTQQFRVFHKGGGSFRSLAERSQAGIPTCSVVFGSSTAGGAYQPGMSDYVIMVKQQAQVFLGGPPLVKMATGEVSTAEDLGGAEMHSRKSGVSDWLADDEFQALVKAREWVASLNWRHSMTNTDALYSKIGRELAPVHRMDSLLDVAQANIKKPWDVTQLIARIADGSRFSAFKPLYGTNTVCGWAYIAGFPVGIIGNNSVLFPSDSDKCTQFIRLCNTRNVPIVWLHNCSGFIVGRQYEESGIIKTGSLMINAVSNSRVPHLSIICGSSYGAANYAMCGRSYGPRFLFSWPQARCSVMGAEALSGVLDIVGREAAARRGKMIDEEKQQSIMAMFKMDVESQSDSYYTSSRMLDDGIIDARKDIEAHPRDTRDVLAFCLEVVNQEKIQGNPGFAGVSRM